MAVNVLTDYNLDNFNSFRSNTKRTGPWPRGLMCGLRPLAGTSGREYLLWVSRVVR